MSARKPGRKQSTSEPSPRRIPVSAIVVAVAVMAAGAWALYARPWQHHADAKAGATQPANAEAPCPMCEVKTPGRFAETGDGPPGMVWVPAGEFSMGDSGGAAGVTRMPWEQPVHRVALDGFYIDRYEVTNAQFQAFVDATGYKTTAERPVDLAEIMKQLPPGTPPPTPDKLLPSSLVFTMTTGPVPTNDFQAWGRWWTWTPGASWKHPTGPGSDLKGKEYHPVVQMSWDDAVAYCKWAGKRLPTEAEWEYAARGGLDAKPFTWGSEPFDPDKPQANIWQGNFPYENTAKDKFEATAPVGQFAPNGYGVYDMAGNVWEWVGDYFDPAYYGRAGPGVTRNPTGPARGVDPDGSPAQKRVMRGGSYLCSDAYCSSYRPSARMHNTPDSATNHQGFRAVMTKAQWDAVKEKQTAK